MLNLDEHRSGNLIPLRQSSFNGNNYNVQNNCQFPLALIFIYENVNMNQSLNKWASG